MLTRLDYIVQEFCNRCSVQFEGTNIRDGKSHQICGNGWAIWFLYGVNEQGSYLDWYESHRMTNDVHMWIYEDGDREQLPSFPEFRACSSDPAEDARLEAKYREQCLAVNKLLEEKGFGLTGREPFSVAFIRVDQLNRLSESKSKDEAESNPDEDVVDLEDQD